MREGSFAEVVASFYDAALGEVPWPVAGAKLRNALGAQYSALYVGLPGARQGVDFTSADQRIAAGRVYHHSFVHLDPFRRFAIQAEKAGRTTGVAGIEEIISSAEYLRSAYYNEFAKNLGFRHAMINLELRFLPFQTVERPSQAPFVVFRDPDNRNGFSSLQKSLFCRFTPHLRRAIQIWGKTKIYFDNSDDLQCIADRFACAAAVIPFASSTAVINTAFAELVSRGLSVVSGRIILANRAEQQRLDLFLHRVTNLGDLVTTAPLAIRSTEGQPPLLVQAMPLPTGSWRTNEISNHASAIVVLVVDPKARWRLQSMAALRALGLSDAQCGVAALIGSGASNSETALELGISEHTVRMHLKHAFEKLQIANRGELVRIIARIATLEASPLAAL